MRVVIAEDAALLREGLIRLLEDRGHEVRAAVADGDALLAAVAEHRPDVAVVDIRMPPTHTDEGLRATGRDELLLLSVTDDGAGGADPGGSGLSGLAQRVSTVDGRLEVMSPPGGPTRVVVELPLRA